MKTTELPEAVRSFIARASVLRMASASATNEPHVVPLCPVYDSEKTLYVDVGHDSINARNIRANPSVEIVIDEYHDNWARLQGVILLCNARAAGEYECDAAWQLIHEKFPQYRSINWEPRLTLALEIKSWSAWGFSETASV